ncbi:hypothetical protein EIP86_006793 [Pleurotus ostreatoroseus]|nr:hypothetical protein EIP86_006793 [Pleurotus ostreatoroseus]
MPLFQVQVAIVLVACEVFSALLLIAVKPDEGKVKLPQVVEDESLQDPFDVTKPEDIVDGEPVDEDKFWARMRLRKLFITVLSAIILVIQSVSLGWSVVEFDRRSIIIYSLHVAFALYLLVISARSVKQEYSRHALSIVHLSVLTTAAVSLLGVTAILPSTPMPVSRLTADTISVPRALWYVVLALYFAVWGLAITTPRGPAYHYPSDRIYSTKTLMAVTSKYRDNVSGALGASVWSILLFSYTTKVVMLGYTSTSLEIGDLPIVPGDMRATHIFASMRVAMRRWKLKIRSWKPRPGSGWETGYRLIRVNMSALCLLFILASVSALLYYAPAYFLQHLVAYLEVDPARENRGWGWVFCVGLFFSNVAVQLIRMRAQLNSILFAKTLVRKDVASSTGASSSEDDDKAKTSGNDTDDKKEEENEFSSKAQVMTLMTTDVDRVSDFVWHAFTLIDSPIELVIGTVFLYHLLGVSCFFGLGVTCLFMPLNHFAGKVVVGAQDNLMKARDERTALMNEILGGIRMLKFMAWERNFENRVLKIRNRELKYQQLNYTIEVLWNAIWNGSPILVTLVAFWHFAVVRGQVLTPSIAFTAISVFEEMKFALNALPETLINMLQSTVSLRRIEKYLNGAEVSPVPPISSQSLDIVLQSATITWPQNRNRSGSGASSVTASAASTPRHKFMLVDMSLKFPPGELSLICGKLGSGKTLLLLALLGEADLLAGQLNCPRSPPDALAAFQNEDIAPEDWVVDGICAYVPQSAWLRNASIRDNILFDLPYNEERYQKTLEVCALLSDLKILEDGDMSEIGERGVNLSGGQKARVSLARAVYSRASVLLLDDVLSAVDAHTARHLFYECLKGDLMRGRTVILVSHHVQLCTPGASYIVALDNGHLQFQGNREDFISSGVLKSLSQSDAADAADEKEETQVHDIEELADHPSGPSADSETSSTTAATAAETETKPEIKKAPRKLVEEEKRAVGRISKDIWLTYLGACGNWLYWIAFAVTLTLAATGPVLENWWLK